MQKRLIIPVVIAAWLVIVGVGLTALLSYENRPAPVVLVRNDWPKDAGLSRPDRVTLYMFVHPRCPCSQASISQLEKIASRLGPDKFAGYVIFQLPSDAPKNFIPSDLWARVTSIPGVTSLVDRNQRAAKAFHATTSGDTYVYDSQGQLVFHGGLTDSRGHEGDSDGSDAVLNIFRERNPLVANTQRFGCALFNN